MDGKRRKSYRDRCQQVREKIVLHMLRVLARYPLLYVNERVIGTISAGKNVP